MKAKEWVKFFVDLLSKQPNETDSSENVAWGERFFAAVTELEKECHAIATKRLGNIEFGGYHRSQVGYDRMVAAFREAGVKWNSVYQGVVNSGVEHTFPLVYNGHLLRFILTLHKNVVLEKQQLSVRECADYREQYELLEMLLKDLGSADTLMFSVTMQAIHDRLNKQERSEAEEYVHNLSAYNELLVSKRFNPSKFSDEERLVALGEWLIKNNKRFQKNLSNLQTRSRAELYMALGVI